MVLTGRNEKKNNGGGRKYEREGGWKKGTRIQGMIK